ncbi:MAG: hypothetical protein ACOX6L_01310 [Syntrophomonadaceae bacterium]|nr:hypothetical protein [Syntrophomonadaceae bacterium]
MGRIYGGSSSGALSVRGIFQTGADEHGIMLVDLLLGLALALLVIVSLQQISTLLLNGYSHNSEQAELQYSSRMALDCIQQDIRTSRDFQVNADGSQLIITGAQGENICIYTYGGNLYRRDVSTVPVAENISAVSFTKTGSRLQGKLKLHSQDDDYEVNYFCYSRVLQAQE